jgi:hypothetical protein
MILRRHYFPIAVLLIACILLITVIGLSILGGIQSYKFDKIVHENKIKAARSHNVFEIFTHPKDNKVYLIVDKKPDTGKGNVVMVKYAIVPLVVSVLYEEYPTSVIITYDQKGIKLTNMFFEDDNYAESVSIPH